jgi:hypothetical protein
MNPDAVCAKYAGKDKVPEKNKLAIHTFKGEDGLEWVLIEGEAQALEFLGKVLIAQAKFKKDCRFHLSPKSAGCAFFKKTSTHGVYIHRIPCLDRPGFKLAKPKQK